MDQEIQKYKHVIIDTNNLFWQSYEHKEGKVLSIGKKEINVGSLETFFHKLNFIISKYGRTDTQYYFLFDNVQSDKSERASFSKVKYKSGREKKNIPVRFYRTLNLLYNILSVYDDNFYLLDTTMLNKNFQPLRVYDRQFEADDLVKLVTQNISPEYHNRCLLISTDLDWARSINDYTDWFNWKDFYTVKTFADKYKFIPTEEKVKMYKAIIGDKSDTIEVGIPGFSGEKESETLIHIMNKNKNVHDLFDNLWRDTEIHDVDKQKIFKSKSKVLGNYNLINFLPIKKEVYEEVCIKAKLDIPQVKLFMESLNLSVDIKFLNNKEITPKQFFNQK